MKIPAHILSEAMLPGHIDATGPRWMAVLY